MPQSARRLLSSIFFSPADVQHLPLYNVGIDPTISSLDHAKYLEVKYDEADLRLCRLEEELDFVIYCSRITREQRTELAQKNMIYSEAEPHERTFEAGDGVVDEYLQLLARSKALDDERAALSKECSEARVDANNLFAKVRYYVRNGWRGFKNKRALEDETFGGMNGSSFGKALIGLDDGCVMDKKTKIERYLQRKESLRNVATIVGVLGASIAFTTLFSANRGRLDLIAWSFTSFIFVVFVNEVPMFLPSHETDLLARGEYFIGSQFNLMNDFLYTVIPLLLGVVLLVLAVTLLDPSSPSPVPGSATAIHVAGYMALGPVINLVLWACTSYGKTILNYGTPILLNPPRRAYGNSKDKLYPSHLLLKDPSTRWSFLPGGEKFFKYRQWRRSQEGFFVEWGQQGDNFNGLIV